MDCRRGGGLSQAKDLLCKPLCVIDKDRLPSMQPDLVLTAADLSNSYFGPPLRQFEALQYLMSLATGPPLGLHVLAGQSTGAAPAPSPWPAPRAVASPE